MPPLYSSCILFDLLLPIQCKFFQIYYSVLDISVQKHEYGALLNQVGVIYINKLFVCVFKLKVKLNLKYL